MSVIDLAEMQRRFLLITEQASGSDFIGGLSAAKYACAACGGLASKEQPFAMQGTMRPVSGRLYAYGLCSDCYERGDVADVIANALASFERK